MSLAIDIDRAKIAEFCRKWRITEFSLFGSVLRDDFRPDSDVDVMISVAPQVRIGLRELYDMEQELEGLFSRKVDLVFRKAVEEGRNWIRRNHILKNNERIV
jgi:predicted nucleotidyltransferase